MLSDIMVSLTPSIYPQVTLPNTTPMASASLDYSFLLLTHLVCADRQIHREESKLLHELADQTQVGQQTIQEMEKILAQEKTLFPVENIAQQIPPEQQQEAMQQLLALAYVDGLFSPLERQMIAQVAQIWHWDATEVEQMVTQAQTLQANRKKDRDSHTEKLSLSAILLMGAESILSRTLIAKLATFAPETLGRRIVQLQRQILLAGPDYEEAVQRNSIIAGENYRFTETALTDTESTLIGLNQTLKLTLENLQKTIHQQPTNPTTTTQELINQFNQTQQTLAAEIGEELNIVRESLWAKQRALHHFSLAVMGKTKVGKSTLHAIIIGEGWEAIGSGGQRTTRFNRVYDWKNIRIIDTPGIGAPGGRTEEEILESVIEESDLICYVVTNDSIQETEFQFLQQLKAKAKPLIILLNLKYNLRDPRRLDYFLKNPDKLFTLEGSSGIGGHIARIRRYAQNHYANDYFDIIPVMLLAAQMASEPEHQANQDKLLKASRIQDFLDSIRESLVKHGAIRRSQTLLGSTVGTIERPYHWMSQKRQSYQQLSATLTRQRETLQAQIKTAGKDHLEFLQYQIGSIFQDVFNSLPDFAESNWNFSQESLKQNWDYKLQALQIDDRLQYAYQTTVQNFNRDVEIALSELGTDLQLMAHSGGHDFQFFPNPADLYSDNAAQIGGSFLRLSQTPVTHFSPPVNKTVMMGAVVLNSILGIFTTREQKRHFAVQRLSKLLAPQIRASQRQIEEQVANNFREYYRHAAGSIMRYIEGLIQEFELISQQFNQPQQQLSQTINLLNLAYSKRIVDWCQSHYEPLTEAGINKTVTQVKREFAKQIDIQTKFQVRYHLDSQEINRILQEDVLMHRLQ
ncbi:GTPase [Coleofasciculus sp. F4-SAH-05]|uniref:GTPase n=1 Tax=Coleofasciculus sp. F4-SAH-05 TaxID=3069525 RepID=UPI0032F8A9D9